METISIKEQLRREKISKANKGSKSGNTNLTEQEAKQIKDLALSEIYKQKDIAKLYSTTTRAVQDIKSGRTWKHLK